MSTKIPTSDASISEDNGLGTHQVTTNTPAPPTSPRFPRITSQHRRGAAHSSVSDADWGAAAAPRDPRDALRASSSKNARRKTRQKRPLASVDPAKKRHGKKGGSFRRWRGNGSGGAVRSPWRGAQRAAARRPVFVRGLGRGQLRSAPPVDRSRTGSDGGGTRPDRRETQGSPAARPTGADNEPG